MGMYYDVDTTVRGALKSDAIAVCLGLHSLALHYHASLFTYSTEPVLSLQRESTRYIWSWRGGPRG